MLHDHLAINDRGHLTIGGLDTVRLAETYGTPLYVLDEAVIRDRMGRYLTAARAAFGDDTEILYAGKALNFKGIYRLAVDEGLGADVVSVGEMLTALAGGMPVTRLYFHGNAKTDADIRAAVDRGLGTFIVDNRDELTALADYCRSVGRTQPVLLRLTPGIDPHTLEAIDTARIDTQFGAPIPTGEAEALLAAALERPELRVDGFHCHIGSQIRSAEPYLAAMDRVLTFADTMRDRLGFTASILNWGGGLAARYREDDTVPDITRTLHEMAEHLRNWEARLGYPRTRVMLEPGRSIVAEAGLTLYTVSSIKPIEGGTDYVTVDGGMTDNPRYALYRAPYTVVAADGMRDPLTHRYTVAGRCCESGDILQKDVPLPEMARGRLVAVLSTGAYNFSMASHYNRLPRPPLVMVKDGEAYVAVRGETPEDLSRFDL